MVSNKPAVTPVLVLHCDDKSPHLCLLRPSDIKTQCSDQLSKRQLWQRKWRVDRGQIIVLRRCVLEKRPKLSAPPSSWMSWLHYSFTLSHCSSQTSNVNLCTSCITLRTEGMWCSECPWSVCMLFSGCKTSTHRSGSSLLPIISLWLVILLCCHWLPFLPSVHPLCTHAASQRYTSASPTFIIGWRVMWMRMLAFKRQSRLSRSLPFSRSLSLLQQHHNLLISH